MLITHRNLNFIATVVASSMALWRVNHRKPNAAYLGVDAAGVGVLAAGLSPPSWPRFVSSHGFPRRRRPERQREPIDRGNRRPLLASESRFMPDQSPNMQNASELRLKALSQWDNEGGAGPDGPQGHSLDVGLAKVPPLSNAELVQLQVRVIALENLMIMLLAEGSDRQLELAREMAAYISPRPGFTHHPLTVQAGAHMVDLVERAIHYRSVDPAMTAAAPTLAKPYKSTPVFDEVSLPAGLRREHRTKAGSWGVIRVLEGRLRYQVLDPSSEVILEPGRPGLILPEQPHLVEPLGPIRMQVEFYDHLPDL